ncbi:MAG: hypothetical protein ACLFVD_01165 [Dehalococcoidia bacterium]
MAKSKETQTERLQNSAPKRVTIEPLEQFKKRIDREAGLDPKRGKKYTSPGGFIKIPTPRRSK